MTARAAGSMVALLATLLPGCPERGFHEVQRQRLEVERLERNRDRWVSAGLVDYEYEFERSCFCDPASTARVRLQVVDGHLESGVYLESFHSWSGGEIPAGTLVPQDALGHFGSIDDVFEDLEATLGGVPHLFDATYDETFGFPARVHILSCRPGHCTDDGLIYQLDALAFQGASASRIIGRHTNRE